MKYIVSINYLQLMLWAFYYHYDFTDIYFLLQLSIYQEMLKSPTLRVDSYIYLLVSIRVCLVHFGALYLSVYT
jgi:hypothetical protein